MLCVPQVLFVLLVAVAVAVVADENGAANVRCDETVMHVEVPATEDVTSVHLQGLREYPDRRCHAARVGDAFVLDLNLVDVFECGVTRMRNEKTGTVTYYHRVMIESSNEAIPMQAVIVSCEISRRKAKRNVLPAGFQEPEELEIQSTLTGHGPKPVLGVNVRQGGIPLTGGQLHVAPGTPLQMEIYLDNTSAPIYGLLVAHMQVTDTGTQEETIIFNGCSVDPYLFDNFNTEDGDFLAAKFRAFKFPDSTYVQFRGTVSVCLDKCKGVECSNGVIGFGKRRKRAIASLPPDPNKIFEITITSFIKVNYEDDTVEQIALEKTFKHNGLITGGEEREAPAKQLGLARDEVQYTAVVEESANESSSANRFYLTYTCLVPLFTMFLYAH